ncbi:uroporphyrinogen-III C-methyltransferase [Aquabacterium sp. OR-4]|uniref:uroporphyrinogen-III C-methyltransferase n=1 Tax=Aquabacterium sp. OR-4 TaxID=2978127 RepID=UPI0021B4B012|nr:uroporphyrinogen-III C-methyltransferase [Aquabacterium sp. OR-4]MDT7835583.1 uroporphyrinogen-III C-methyltransferase [Aquabacterium sp. OR-4]
MNDTDIPAEPPRAEPAAATPTAATPAAPAAPAAVASAAAAPGAPPAAVPVVAAAMLPGWALPVGALVGTVAVVSLTLALLGQQRVKALEQELVRRQQDSQGQAVEARALARQALDTVQATESKMALLDARVSETALQRTQLEELIQQLSRSRDENALADIDAALRVAVQQGAITGSAEPLTAALRQAEDRLARMNQPRLERVRRAIARDLDRVRAVAVTDIASLTIRLDEAIRTVDELPLTAQIERRNHQAGATASAAASAAAKGAAAARAASGAASVPAEPAWVQWWTPVRDGWLAVTGRIWQEVRDLVRVTRIDAPEAMLVAPEQAWFLRENLKLRLLNARLALLSRQFDTAQSDLRDALGSLERYFDHSARRVMLTAETVRQVAGQARQLNLPRPDETLAALAAAQAGR